MISKYLFIVLILIASIVYQKSITTTTTTTTTTTITTSDITMTATKALKKKLQPVLFLSHGGPTFMYKDKTGSDLGAFETTAKIGKDIKNIYKPDYIVVLSGHWQPEYTGPESLNNMKIAVPSALADYGTVNDKDQLFENSLIYDFYGFPDEMYSTKFKNYVSKDTVQRLANIFKKTHDITNLNLETEIRGIDHGAWVPLKVAELDKYETGERAIPLVQMSILPSSPLKISSMGKTSYNGNENTKKTFVNHYQRIGSIIKEIRKDNGLVICSGMSVHNLSDLGYAFADPTSSKFSYVDKFNLYLQNMLNTHKMHIDNGESGNKHIQSSYLLYGLLELSENPSLKKLLYQAHSPTIDHFLPFVAACGSLTDGEYGKELYNNKWGSLGWGIYQFGQYD